MGLREKMQRENGLAAQTSLLEVSENILVQRVGRGDRYAAGELGAEPADGRSEKYVLPDVDVETGSKRTEGEEDRCKSIQTTAGGRDYGNSILQRTFGIERKPAGKCDFGRTQTGGN